MYVKIYNTDIICAKLRDGEVLCAVNILLPSYCGVVVSAGLTVRLLRL
jgi:hypothetical protein